MDFSASLQETAATLCRVALEHNCDLRELCNSFSVFEKDARWIEFWVQSDVIRYHLSGEVSTPPRQIVADHPMFTGIWDETGSLTSFDQAVRLAKAWLLDGEQVDLLPTRETKRWTI